MFQVACRLLMLEQVVFSLPWSLAAIMLAWDEKSPDAWLRATLAILGVILARTAGMSLNRWIDRHIDTLNPRTSSRPLQAGQIKLQQVVVLTLANLALLFMVAASLGWIFVVLSPVVMGLLVLYSYSKRFTWACHLILGLIYSLGPILSYLVISGNISLPAVLLGISAGCSIIGGDLIYSMQDMHHDRSVGLHSIPARFGFEGAKVLSCVFYMTSIASLGLCGYLLWGFAPLFWTPWILFAALPLWLHMNLSKQGKIYSLFFRCSCLMPFMALLAILCAQGVNS